MHCKLDVDKVAIFGQSLGGVTAASAMLVDGRFACGSNLAGSFWGDVVTAGLSKPFFIVGAEEHNRTSDESWATFYQNLRGFRLGVNVNGTVHLTFDDQAYLYGVLREAGLIPDLGNPFGTIDGKWILVIEGTYLGVFFEYCLEGRKERLLQGP